MKVRLEIKRSGLVIGILLCSASLGCGPARPFNKVNKGNELQTTEKGAQEPQSIALRLGIRLVPEEEKGLPFGCRFKRPDPKVNLKEANEGDLHSCTLARGNELAFCEPLNFPLFDPKESEAENHDRFFVWAEDSFGIGITQVQVQHSILRKNNRWQTLSPDLHAEFDSESRRWFISLNEIYLNILTLFPDLLTCQNIRYPVELRLHFRLKDDTVEKVFIRFTLNFYNKKRDQKERT